MTEFRHDPNSLADRLDQLLPPGQPEQIGTEGDALVETAARLASAPRPRLSPEAMARIQTRVAQAHPIPQRPTFRLPSPARLTLVAVVTMIVVAGTVFAANKLGITLVVPSTPTSSSTPTVTATVTPSATSSFTPSATASPTVTSTGTLTNTASPTETDMPTAEAALFIAVSPTFTRTPTSSYTPLPLTPTATSPPVSIVVEGPIQAISGNIIVIYDIEIEINPNDPILAVIQVGDLVRVEAGIDADGEDIVVIAVTVTVVDIEVNVSPDGEVWRDTGDCSNPPPEWAPAHGWRARCEGAPAPGNSGGMGDDDDD